MWLQCSPTPRRVSGSAPFSTSGSHAISFIPRRVPSAAIPVVRSSRFGHDYALGLGRAPATNTLPRASSNFRSPFRLGDPESIQPDSDRAAPLLVCAPVGSFGAARAGGAMQQYAAQLKQMPVGDDAAETV